MAQRPRRRGARRALSGEAGAFCPAAWEHEVEVPRPGGRAVRVIALSCPSCTRPSATDVLSQILAARRRTIVGVARLPAGIRSGLAAAGTLRQLYQGTLAEVREAAEQCREWLGVELPATLSVAVGAPAPDRAQVTAALDAASNWVAMLRARKL